MVISEISKLDEKLLSNSFNLKVLGRLVKSSVLPLGFLTLIWIDFLRVRFEVVRIMLET